MNYSDLKKADPEGLYKETIIIDRHYAIGDLARMMQKVTENAMGELGTDFHALKEKDLIWVLCFSEISIGRMPAEGETLQIFTWPGENRFGMSSRRYALYSPEGERLMTCASLFSTVDRKTRTMVTPGQAGVSFPVVVFADEPAFPKLKEKGPETPMERQHAVTAHEIDKNDHVNNAFYLDWIENMIGDSLHTAPDQIRRIWISYAREIRAGETVLFRYGQENGQLFVKGSVGKDTCFTALISS